MAIKVTGFSDVGGLRKKLEILVSKKSEAIILNHKEAMKRQLQDAATAWQFEIKKRLSEPVQKSGSRYLRNTSLWPRMEHGRLVKDIREPNIFVDYKARATKTRKNQIRYKITNFYGEYIGKVGVTLDTMADDDGGVKPFAGWLTRANHIWDDMMRERLARPISRYL